MVIETVSPTLAPPSGQTLDLEITESAPTFTSPSTSNPTPTLRPTSTPLSVSTPVIPDTGWIFIRPGLEHRLIRLFDAEGAVVETIHLLRIDPAMYQFNVAYQAENPPTLDAWQTQTEALIVLNGGYFRREGALFLPTGLAIINGQPLGSSYDSFAGMLAISDQKVSLRWLQQTPYDPDEPLLAALQSFPLLVKPGGKLGFPEQHEDGQKARRTVIGQDKAGWFLFLVASQGHFTLHQLSLYLTASDLNLDIAVNLDGGPSSGMLLTEPAVKVPAFSPLPLVIIVHPR